MLHRLISPAKRSHFLSNEILSFPLLKLKKKINFKIKTGASCQSRDNLYATYVETS
jgi:hypothetical protein